MTTLSLTMLGSTILAAILLVPSPAPAPSPAPVQDGDDTRMRTIEFDDCVIDVRPIWRQPIPPPSQMSVFYDEVAMPNSGGGGGAKLKLVVPLLGKIDVGNLVGNELTTLKAGETTNITVTHDYKVLDNPLDDKLAITIVSPDGTTKTLTDVPVRGEFSRFGKLDFRLENFPVFTARNTQRVRLYVDYYGLETAITMVKVHAH